MADYHAMQVHASVDLRGLDALRRRMAAMGDGVARAVNHSLDRSTRLLYSIARDNISGHRAFARMTRRERYLGRYLASEGAQLNVVTGYGRSQLKQTHRWLYHEVWNPVFYMALQEEGFTHHLSDRLVHHPWMSDALEKVGGAETIATLAAEAGFRAVREALS